MKGSGTISHRIALLAFVVGAFQPFCARQCARADEAPPKARRVIYNLDGDSCTTLKKNAQGPAELTVDDLKAIVGEISYPGSQVDTLLVCINAQVMYYPTKVGTLRGTLSTPTEREKWSAHEHQRLANMMKWFDAGIDPYAVILAEARGKGLEALLTFRMNDDHGNDFLRTQFWQDHPEYRLGRGALDWRHDAVREYVFRLVEEAVTRYDCDGLELDFERFPNYFAAGQLSEAERIAKVSSFVERVRKRLAELGRERNRRLVLAARVPTSRDAARQMGCDAEAWAAAGWIDFLTVSEFLFVRYDLPVKPWKERIKNIPIYGSIECTEGPKIEQCLTADKYRRAARHLLADGADGVYLFNFFTTREHEGRGFEPPFEVLRDLANR
jgi:hypothetical protein